MTDYDGQVLCGVDDRLGAFGQMCKWPAPDITWSIVGNLPGIEPDSFRRVCGLAWDAWAKVCGIRPRFVEGPSNLSIGLQTIGPGNVLADCELPCGATMQSRLRMRIDTAEAWVISDNPPNNRVDLLRVLIHELGHGIGIPHIGTGNLMAPIYSARIGRPQSGDISEGVSRYGLANPNPPQPPLPPGEYREILAVLEKGGAVFVRKNGVISPL
jgi:hypothetical protein